MYGNNMHMSADVRMSRRYRLGTPNASNPMRPMGGMTVPPGQASPMGPGGGPGGPGGPGNMPMMPNQGMRQQVRIVLLNSSTRFFLSIVCSSVETSKRNKKTGLI